MMQGMLRQHRHGLAGMLCRPLRTSPLLGGSSTLMPLMTMQGLPFSTLQQETFA